MALHSETVREGAASATIEDMQSTNRGGRPPVTDLDSIALAATDLFRAQGYEQTTMEEIAASLGIGRTTLFRYFPTKASILWHHHDVYAELFQQELAATPPDVPLVDAPFRAYVQFIRRRRPEAPFVKAMMAVIVRSGPEATGNWTRFGAWAGYIAAFMTARRGGDPSDFENEGLGLVIWSALWTGLTHWAVSGAEQPDAFLVRARALLGNVEVSRL